MTKPVAPETVEAPVTPPVRVEKAKKEPLSPAGYLAAIPTENQEMFLSWVLAETGVKFGSKAATDAFALGVRAAGLYSRYQASKKAK